MAKKLLQIKFLSFADPQFGIVGQILYQDREVLCLPDTDTFKSKQVLLKTNRGVCSLKIIVEAFPEIRYRPSIDGDRYLKLFLRGYDRSEDECIITLACDKLGRSVTTEEVFTTLTLLFQRFIESEVGQPFDQMEQSEVTEDAGIIFTFYGRETA